MWLSACLSFRAQTVDHEECRRGRMTAVAPIAGAQAALADDATLAGGGPPFCLHTGHCGAPPAWRTLLIGAGAGLVTACAVPSAAPPRVAVPAAFEQAGGLAIRWPA